MTNMSSVVIDPPCPSNGTSNGISTTPLQCVKRVQKVWVLAMFMQSDGPRLLLQQHTPSGEWSPVGGTVDIHPQDYTRMGNTERADVIACNGYREALEECGVDLVSKEALMDRSKTTRIHFTPNVKEDDCTMYLYKVYMTDVSHAMLLRTHPDVLLQDSARYTDRTVSVLPHSACMIVDEINDDTTTKRDKREVSAVKFVSLQDLWNMKTDKQLWEVFGECLDRCNGFRDYFDHFLPKLMSVRAIAQGWAPCPWEKRVHPSSAASSSSSATSSSTREWWRIQRIYSNNEASNPCRAADAIMSAHVEDDGWTTIVAPQSRKRNNNRCR